MDLEDPYKGTLSTHVLINPTVPHSPYSTRLLISEIILLTHPQQSTYNCQDSRWSVLDVGQPVFHNQTGDDRSPRILGGSGQPHE